MPEEFLSPSGLNRVQEEPDAAVVSSNPRRFPEIYNANLDIINDRMFNDFDSPAERDAAMTPIAGTSQVAFTRDEGVFWISDGGVWREMWRRGGGEWQTYTPAFYSFDPESGQESGPLAIGSGTISGRYRLIDPKTCVVKVRLVRGSSTNIGNGLYRFSLPFTARDSTDVGSAVIRHQNGVPFTGTAFLLSNTRIAIYLDRATGGDERSEYLASSTWTRVGGTLSDSWMQGDTIDLSLTYEVR